MRRKIQEYIHLLAADNVLLGKNTNISGLKMMVKFFLAFFDKDFYLFIIFFDQKTYAYEITLLEFSQSCQRF